MIRRYKLLGSLEITEEGRPSPATHSPKGSALLAYLIVTNQSHSREAVADLLWDATSTRQSLKNLRSLLPRIRTYSPELIVGRSTLSFQSGPGTLVDLFQLEATLGSSDWPQLDNALRLYEGDLLTGFHLPDAPRFNEWLLLARERLRLRVLDGYHRLCNAYAAEENWLPAIEAARRMLALDDLDETALRSLLRLLAASNHQSVALQQYKHSRQRILTELGVEPEPATVALARTLAAAQARSANAPVSGQARTWDMAQSTPVRLPDADTLAEPGPLPPHAYVPYRRNDDFVGRQEVLLHIARHLLPRQEDSGSGAAPLAITGMGGLGKTQTAVEFAYRYGRFYPGGVFWISFANEQQVSEEVAAIGAERGLGLFQEYEQLTLAEKVGRVQRAWQEPTPRLLIFDGCEDEQLLAQWCPVTGGCRVLVTCRRGDWFHEHKVTSLALSVLSSAESEAYLRRVVPRLQRQEAQGIAAEVGQLPLALHLAGGFLRRYSRVSAAQYLIQLRSNAILQHPSLQGRGSNYSPTGHELNVIRTFSASLAQLNPRIEAHRLARRLLARAACFVPDKPVPIPLLLATVVANQNDLTAHLKAEDGLSRLIALGFLKSISSEQVVIHRLVAAFTNAATIDDQAQVSVEQTLLTALADQLEAIRFLGKLPVALSHVRFVTDTALKEAHELASRLATALGRHLREIGEFDSAQWYLEQALATAETQGDLYTLGRSAVFLIRVLESQGNDQKALHYLDRTENELRSAGPESLKWLAEALHRKGWVYFRLGRVAEAQSAAAESRILGEQLQDKQVIANGYNLLGAIASYWQADYESADGYMTHALTLLREVGDRFGEGTLLSNLGENARFQGKYSAALPYCQSAVAVAQETGNLTRKMIYLLRMSSAQIGLEQYETAVKTLLEIVASGPTTWRILPEAYCRLAEAYLGLGQLDAALQAAQLALAHAETSHYPSDIGQAWYALGCIARNMNAGVPVRSHDGSLSDAPTCFRQSLAIFSSMDLKRNQALVLWKWAEYELCHDNQLDAERMRLKALALFTSLKLPLMIARMHADTPPAHAHVAVKGQAVDPCRQQAIRQPPGVRNRRQRVS